MSGKTKTDSLRVLVLATTYPRWEGDQVPGFVHELSKELHNNDLEVIVLVPHHPGAQRRETLDGLKVYRYPYFFPYRYQQLVFQGGILPTIKRSFTALLQVPFLLFSLLLHTFWIVKKENIDIVHSHWIVPNGVVGSLVSSRVDIPHIMTLHAGGVLGLQGVPLNSYIANFVYNRSNAIVPVSEHISDSFKSILKLNEDSITNKFHIQPMGAHTEDFDNASKWHLRDAKGIEDEVIGLYVGRLAEKKGLLYLLEAIADLETNQDFRLMIVGTGSLEEELHDYTAEKGLKDYVEFTGWVSEEELHERYVLADFVVVPSIETKSGDTEGMPTVIAEAFASGNPVIASEVGGIPDVVIDGENGYLVQQKQPDEISGKIEILIDEPDTRSELSKGALETAEKLDWQHCGETYAQLLRSAHASGRVTKKT